MTLRMVILAAVAMVAMTTASASAQELPDGSGKAEFVATCSVCHGLDQVIVHRMSRDDWALKINSMRGFGAEGTDDDFTKIAEYLAANFGNASASKGSAKTSALLSTGRR